MFVYAAEVAELARRGPELGVDTRFEGADWPAIRDRVFGRIDPIAAGGEDYRSGPRQRHRVRRTTPASSGRRSCRSATRSITADKIVLAAGARAIRARRSPGLDDGRLPHVRHDHADRRASRAADRDRRRLHRRRARRRLRRPRQRGHLSSCAATRCCATRTTTSAQRFTEIYGRPLRVARTATPRSTASSGDDDRASQLVDRAGETRDPRRRDSSWPPAGSPTATSSASQRPASSSTTTATSSPTPTLRTNVDGIWALGDITNPVQLKHVANHEAKVVAHNITHPDDRSGGRPRLHPRTRCSATRRSASVGLTEQQCIDAGLPHTPTSSTTGRPPTAGRWRTPRASAS